jgi:uncharacterized protein (DUF302 family)
MLITQTSRRPYAEVCARLNDSCGRHGYGVLASHDIGATLHSKGLEHPAQCRVFEICHPGHAAEILAADPHLAAALPCRIAAVEQNGTTTLSMLSPRQLLQSLNDTDSVQALAEQVEQDTVAILTEAAAP